MLGDLNAAGQQLLVAQGGERGLGNAAFKSSTNRAPRRTRPGQPGDVRKLRLQLKLLADVGLLGLPNAGKSTLIGQVSAANPKVADYPFTTLVPSLGVVRIAADASFVMADIPGLIVGAAEGAGLGAQFLRHLSRTRVLLHLVDVVPEDGSDPVTNALAIEDELAQYSPALLRRPVWLALSKVDQLEADELDELASRMADFFPEREIYQVSALGDIGLDKLTSDLMSFLTLDNLRLADEAEYAEDMASLERQITDDVFAHSERMRRAKALKRAGLEEGDADWDQLDDDAWEEGDTEVVYVRD